MMKKYIVWILFFSLFLSGCGKQSTEETIIAQNEAVEQPSNVFVVGQKDYVLETLYATVVANTINTIQTTIAGDLNVLNCQPGTRVYKNTLIAKIVPDLSSNVNVENSLIQKTFLEQQFESMETTIQKTEENLDIQREILEKQQAANEKSLDKLRDQQKKFSGDLSSQIDALKLAIKLADDQLDALENTKEIQLTSLENQKSTLLQNLTVLENTLANTYETEIINAGLDGIVKAKLVNEGNKVGPNTALCQIVPLENDALKIQIYSPFQIPLGRVVAFVDKSNVVLGTGVIGYELPTKDISTQNYTYEIVNVKIPVKEGDKLTVKLKMPLETNKLWIPIDAVMAQLDGNFVQQKSGSQIVKTAVQLGDMNGGNIQVVSGLSKGDEIVY